MNRVLLREYVRGVLREDETGGVYGDLLSANMAMSPYGAHYANSDELYKIFIKPFVDVFDTAVGKTKELSRRAQTLAKVGFETLVTTFIPMYADSYKDIFEKEKEHLDKIKQEYGDVYRSNWDAWRDNDIFWTAFCYAPWAVMTVKLIKGSPRTAAKMVSALTGGAADHVLGRLFGGWLQSSPPPATGLNGKDSNNGGGGDFGPLESLMREAEREDDRLGAAARTMTSEKFLDALRRAPRTKALAAETQAVVRGSLDKVFKEAQAVLRARSLEELERTTGKRPKGLEQFADIPADQRRKVEQAVLTELRRTLRDFYVKSTEALADDAIQAGVPESSPYVQDVRRAVARLKAL